MKLPLAACYSCAFILLALMGLSPSFADVPTISVIPDQTVPEGGKSLPISFTVISTNYVLKASASDPALVPSTNIVFGGSGINRIVTITAATNRFGQATVTIEADGSNGGALTTFLVTVNAQLHLQDAAGRVTLSWSATNSVLQSANQLGLGWSDLYVQSPYTIPRGKNQFFRLQQR